MTSAKDVYPNDLIEKAAEELKKIEEIKPPVWTVYVKTGAHKERAPLKKDWWYHRAAAVLRSVYILGPIGVSKLKTKYGGKRRRGHKSACFRKGSGSIIRKSLQQLEKAGLIKFKEIGVYKGRVITPKGKSLLDKIAAQILKQQNKGKVKAKPEKKPAEKIKEEKTKEVKKEQKQEKTKPKKETQAKEPKISDKENS